MPAPTSRRIICAVSSTRPDTRSGRRSGFSPQARRSGVTPARTPPLETEALHGESVTVYDESEGWAWVQLDRDKYVGYLAAAALAGPFEPTHRVVALRTHAYPGPSIKRRRGWRCRSARGSRSRAVTAISQSRRTGSMSGLRHLVESGWREPDYVAVAERFLETPYLWGGRTSEGIDCSGLVQTALAAAGVASPRDSDMQEAGLGEPIAIDDPRTTLERGDLVFWKGHVGIMRDSDNAPARQRLAHEGRQRTARRSAHPDRRQRRRECDERAEAVGPPRPACGERAGVRGGA